MSHRLCSQAAAHLILKFLAQGVIALVRELALACPMVALHEASTQLASGNPRPAAEPISVHDLATGRKKRAVHFRYGTRPRTARQTQRSLPTYITSCSLTAFQLPISYELRCSVKSLPRGVKQTYSGGLHDVPTGSVQNNPF